MSEIIKPLYMENFDVSSTARFISEKGFERVTLQFPDSLLKNSFDVVNALKELCDAEFYILADTSHGSCCIDHVAAAHVNADLIVHYGPACLTMNSFLPAKYVFPKENIDLSSLAEYFGSITVTDKITIVLANSLFHQQQNIRQLLSKIGRGILMDEMSDFYDPSSPDPLTGVEVTDTIMYIGREVLEFSNLMMRHREATFYSFDPLTSIGRLQDANVNRMLMKRYKQVQDSQRKKMFGIISGTVGMASAAEILDKVKFIIDNNECTWFHFVIGKINPEKLANFLEIDVFVLIGCPFTSFLNSSDFHKPIITPFELELVFEDNWDGKYSVDAKDFLSSTIVARKETGMSLIKPRASEFLSSRVFQGLDPDLVTDLSLSEGKCGIARSYNTEL